eukprot:Selendium_serpulae@DN6276_c0_g1_i2.p2
MMDDMKAVVVPRFGGPDVLTCDETAREECPSNKVSVKVIVAGLNPFDTYVREGTYFTLPTPPYIPGSDFAGVIDVVGDQVPPQPWLKTGNTSLSHQTKFLRCLKKLLSKKAQPQQRHI